MTRRRAGIARRSMAGLTLEITTEMAVAGLLWTWNGFRTDEWHTRRFWASIGHAHGDRLNDKVREAFPGCRAGWRYAVGEFPPVPLVEALPPEHIDNREHLDVDGVRHWYCGGPWQRCQAEHLRDLGVIDGAEWRDYLRWRDAGFPARYVLDGDATGRPCDCIVHGCWR